MSDEIGLGVLLVYGKGGEGGGFSNILEQSGKLNSEMRGSACEYIVS